VGADQAMLVAIQNMLTYWFLILSVVYFVICTPHPCVSVGLLGLFFAVYVGIGGCAL